MQEPNFLLLFFLTMLFLSICLLVFYKFDVLEPGVLLPATMGFSAFMAYLNMGRWSLPFGFESWVLLTLAIVMFQFGSLYCYIGGFIRSKNVSPFIIRKYTPSLIMTGFCCVIMICMAIFSFHELYELSIQLGNTEGVANILKVVRPAVEKQSVYLSRWMNYRQVVAQSIASIYAYLLLSKIISSQMKLRDLFLIFPVILYVPFMIMTTGRMAMMTFGIYIFVLGTILYKIKNRYSIVSNQKSILFLLFAGVAVIGAFLLMGYFTGKIAHENRTVSMIIAHYAGVSLPAFDEAIHSIYTDDGFIGSSTLLGLYRILGRIGFSTPHVDLFLPFVKFDGIDTNVYTAEWRYYKDFGIMGMSAIMWVLGAFYTFFYNKIKYCSSSPFIAIFYSSIVFPLFLSSIDERFFIDLFGTSILYQFLLLYLCYKIVICKSATK